MEQLPSFHARDAQLLWCITSTLSDAVGVTVRASDDLGRVRSGQRVGQACQGPGQLRLSAPQGTSAVLRMT